MMKKTLTVILFWLLSLPIIGQSTSFDFRRINNSLGLSNNTVIAIIQDNKGFLWIGTDDGLNRFDGFNFKIFKPQPKNENSIRHNIAKAIFEDSKGNIWIGTDGGGVSKYDPVYDSFTNYFHKNDDTLSLSHNNVSSIIEDLNGNIWVGTYGGGLNLLQNNHFVHFRAETNNKNSISSDYINTLYCDDGGNLWIGTWAKGVDFFDISSNTFRNFQNKIGNPASLSSNTINCFHKDNKNILWVGTWQGGLCYFDRNKGSFFQVSLIDSNGKNYNTTIIRSISEDHLGFLWLGSFGDGLIRFNPKNGKIEQVLKNEPSNPYSLINNNIWTTCFSKDHMLWVGTIEGGLNKLDLNKRRFDQITKVTDNYDPLKTTIITSLAETKTGQVIAGTREDGFTIFDPQLKNFVNIKKNSSSNSLINNSVSSIIEDQEGNFWIGTQDGLSYWVKNQNRFINYNQNIYNSLSLSINNITQAFEDHQGIIWIATWGGGVNKFIKESNRFEHYLAANKTRVTFRVDMTGHKVSEKGVYITGFMNGWNPSETRLFRIDDNVYGIALELFPGRLEYKFLNGNAWGNEEKVTTSCAENNNRVLIIGNRDIDIDPVPFGSGCTNLKFGPANDLVENHIASNHVYCIVEDYTGTIWFGTNNGLSKFDSKKNEFKNYSQGNSETSISDNHVNSIHIDKNGNLWIGTLGGGINFFDVKAEKFTTYTESEGLANNMVKSILEDKHENLWISTNNGISKFNTKSKDFVNFDTYNGLKESFFHSGSYLKRKNGQLLFGSANGITIFNPDSIETAAIPGDVMLTDLQLFYKSVPVGKMHDGREILKKSIQYTDEIKLSYKDNIITFQFSSMQFGAPEKNRFAYKLEGFDEDWHFTDARNRSATYTNLNGGSYKFLVKTLSSEGIWNEPKMLKVYIKPPFWKTTVFYVLVIILFIVVGYFWYHLRIKAREHKLINEKVLAESKVIQLEKEKLETEIEHKNNELASMTLHMSNKAKLLNEQISHIEMIARQSDSSTQEKLTRLVGKLQQEVSMDTDWEFFERHFDKVHQNFISNLKEKFPDLSANEIRLAAYIRMGMSTKEIADVTNKTIRGVESGRYRLRQNLNLDTSDNLNDFLFKL